MAERLFGIETEYAFSAVDRPGNTIQPGAALEMFMDLARHRLPCLPSAQGSGVFLQNGARLYVDNGSHPELTTPEVANPWDICRYVQAGERILTELSEELRSQNPRIEGVQFFRCNVDYSGALSTWGCHESYLHRAKHLELLPNEIIPHLVSRIIYAGAGGFNALSRGVEFTLSPRALHLRRNISESSTGERGIVHTKDESLSGYGYHRLHLICGESLCSEIATFLKVGATALVVALIEAEKRPGEAVQLRNPLEAMRTFAFDPECKARVMSATNAELTAIVIQRHYLEQAEAHMHDSFMPPWAEAVCREWRTMLDRLERGAPASVAATLDWAMKYFLCRNRVLRHGMDWDSLSHWTPVVDALGNALERTPFKNQMISLQFLLSAQSPIPDEVARLTPFLREQGLLWDEFRRFLDVRQELFEIDARFGQLGSNGIFTVLDRAGSLQHHFSGVDNIEHAIANPPAIGRAALRGKCVQLFAGKNGRYVCDWSGVWDRQAGRFLDLSEPFATEEKWVAVPKPKEPERTVTNPAMEALLGDVWELYERGLYERAHEMLSHAERYRSWLGSEQLGRFLHLNALVQARRGFLDGPQYLSEMARQHADSLSVITDFVTVYRFQGLTPAPAIADWIRRGQERLARNEDGTRPCATTFLSHVAYWLNRRGRPHDALAVLEQACQPDRQEVAYPRILARVFAERGETNRLLGNRREAVYWLREARRIQRTDGYDGELADFTLTYRAKLETDAKRAKAWLKRAKAIQTERHNVMGEARTLLLEARFCVNPGESVPIKEQVLRLRDQRPALAQCRLLAKILARWDEWAGGEASADENGDFYWGV